MTTIILGGGCFWCLEASYKLINGIESVTSGYAGGTASEADYDTVSSGTTNHAEVVKLTYNPDVITLDDILNIFWIIHDPTTPDRQGADVGRQYRSIIFYSDDQQRDIAKASIERVQKIWNDPIVTELEPLEDFYPAEDYHQNYFENHPEQAYCQVVINPKLTKLREKFAERLK